MMKKTLLLLWVALTGLSALATIPDGYYAAAVGQQDEGLMAALEAIINPHTKLNYNYLWDAYEVTDKGEDGYYIDMYSTCKYDYNSPHPGGASYVGQGLNREHSFPKSWFGGEVDPMFTDLTMIIPVDAYVNQRRSNNPYGVCASGVTYVNEELGVSMLGKLGTSTYNGYTSTVYEPDDEYKGDLARIYFYMVTCYMSQVASWPGCDQLDYADNGYKAFSDWSIQMLLEWHRADPVSDKERSRNEAVYSEQNNRNPFVDCPELAEYIWGTRQHVAWTGQNIPEPIDKRTPVMLPVDTATIAPGAFRADWTSGGDVSSYTLHVDRIAASEDDLVTLMMTENFSGINATSDGSNDIGNTLDRYTDNPGWTGYKVYTAAGQSVKVGTTRAIGYLLTPELDLSSTVSVVFDAKNWSGAAGSDGSSVIVSCGDVSKTVTLADTVATYTVVLCGCSDSKVQFSMTAVSKRFYIYRADVYNGDLTLSPAALRDVVEEGDSTWRTVSGITDTCYTVQALAAGVYEYYVRATYTDGTQSEWSNIQHATLTAGGLTLKGDVNSDGEVDINDVTALIGYVLTGGGEIDTDAADLNDDTLIDINDITALIDTLLGKR